MTKDYAKKHTPKKKARKGKRGSYIALWLFTLIVFALFTVGLVYLGKHQREIRHHKKTTIKHVVVAKPECNTTAPKPSLLPKFDFYTLLPQKNKNAAIPEYELEVATVKNYADADHVKAELSLLGLEANIDSFKCGSQQLFLVTAGPYDNKDAAESDLQRLKQNNIKSIIKKVR